MQQELFSSWGIQLETQGQEQRVVEAIQQGTTVAVSDGSFQDQAGLVAWTIKSDTKQHQIRGYGQTLGAAQDQTAYRSELFGIWGILIMLQQIMEPHQVVRESALSMQQSNIP